MAFPFRSIDRLYLYAVWYCNHTRAGEIDPLLSSTAPPVGSSPASPASWWMPIYIHRQTMSGISIEESQAASPMTLQFIHIWYRQAGQAPHIANMRCSLSASSSQERAIYHSRIDDNGDYWFVGFLFGWKEQK